MDDLIVEKEHKPRKYTRSQPVDDGYVKILIPKTKEDVRDVYVSHNFKTYNVQRGVAVDVPTGVVTALSDAVETKYFPVEDPVTGKKTLVPQDVNSVPFQILS